MGAYTTLAVNQDSYNRIIDTIKNGYTGKDGIKHRPAPNMACCLVIQANLGCGIGDILHLSLSSLVRDGDHYRLDIVEQKQVRRGGTKYRNRFITISGTTAQKIESTQSGAYSNFRSAPSRKHSRQ